MIDTSHSRRHGDLVALSVVQAVQVRSTRLAFLSF